MTRLLTIALLALLAAAFPASAGARLLHPGDDLRGPARAARRPGARRDARRDQGLRRRSRARARVLAAVRPARDLEAPAALRRERSRRLSGGHVGPARPPDRRHRGARHDRAAHAHRPGAEVGDARAARLPHRPRAQALRPVGDRGRAALRAAGRPVVDLERAQPAAVPPAAVQARPAGVPRALPQALPRGGAGAAPRARRLDRHGPVRGDLAGGQRADRLAAGLPPRGAVPGRGLQQARGLPPAADRRLRPPRLHQARGPDLPLRGPRRGDDRRARPAGPCARPGRAGRGDPAPARHLPDRVRDPEPAGHDRRRLVHAPGRVHGHLGADRVRQPARRGVLPVPDARRRTAPERADASTATPASRPGSSATAGRSSRATAASRSRSPSRPTAAATCSGAACGPLAA